MKKDKYALLDTDFISKTHIIYKDAENHLIDRIMELPHYQFYCHSQIRTELSRHSISGAIDWLEEKISAGQIVCYDDGDILNGLGAIYGASASAMYARLLKIACEAYKIRYFDEKFKRLQQLNYQNISASGFLEKLNEDCDNIGVEAV